jgi:hypothetical protein
VSLPLGEHGPGRSEAPAHPPGTDLSSIVAPLDTAIELLRRGLWPVAIHRAGTTISKKGGCPRIATGKEPIGKGWGLRRPTESSLVEIFGANLGAGVGLLLGPKSGVIDFEVDGPGGEASLLELLGGEIVQTLGWTSRRGAHRLFCHGPRIERFGPVVKLPDRLPGLEIRIGGSGGQFQSVCPPTTSDDGYQRRWNGCNEIAELPDAALSLLESLSIQRSVSRPRRPPRARPAAHCEPSVPGGGGCPSYANKALQDEVAMVAGATEGSRHVTLRSAGLRLAALAKGTGADWAPIKAKLVDAVCEQGLPLDEAIDVVDWTWDMADPRKPVSSRPTAHRPEEHRRMQPGNDSSPCMQSEDKLNNDPHALRPKEKHVGHFAQACGSFPGGAQACGSKLGSQACGSFSEQPQACGSSLDLDVRVIAWKRALSGDEADWGVSLFDLRRQLELIAVARHWNEQTWKEVSAYWLTVSRSNGAELPGFDSVWGRLKKMLARPIKELPGDTLALVVARIPRVDVPSDINHSKLAAVARVMIAFAEVHAELGRATFHLSFRDIAELAGEKSHKTAGRYLAKLGGLGYLSMVKAGTQGTMLRGDATDWKWHNPPCPGEAVWNNNSRERRVADQADAELDSEAPDPGDELLFDAYSVRPDETVAHEVQAEVRVRPFEISPEALAELIEERAAIMQFDGGLSREDAERGARLDVDRVLRAAGLS